MGGGGSDGMVVDAAWAGWPSTVARINNAKIQITIIVFPIQRSVIRIHVFDEVCPADTGGFIVALRSGLAGNG